MDKELIASERQVSLGHFFVPANFNIKIGPGDEAKVHPKLVSGPDPN